MPVNISSFQLNEKAMLQKVYDVLPEKMQKIANSILENTIAEFMIETAVTGKTYLWNELESIKARVDKVADNEYDIAFDMSQVNDFTKQLFEFYMGNGKTKYLWNNKNKNPYVGK